MVIVTAIHGVIVGDLPVNVRQQRARCFWEYRIILQLQQHKHSLFGVTRRQVKSSLDDERDGWKIGTIPVVGQHFDFQKVRSRFYGVQVNGCLKSRIKTFSILRVCPLHVRTGDLQAGHGSWLRVQIHRHLFDSGV